LGAPGPPQALVTPPPPPAGRSRVQQAVLDAVVSPWGVSALVLIAVYVLSLVLLATIRPPFVMQPPSSRLETETFSAKRAAIGAAVATLVACVVIAIVFIVAFYRKPSVGGKRG
jgi:hypothetical protein